MKTIKDLNELLKTYKAIELAKQEGKTRQTIYNNGRLYIPIMIPSKRSQKWYSIRYIKKSDLDSYLNSNGENGRVYKSTKASNL